MAKTKSISSLHVKWLNENHTLVGIQWLILIKWFDVNISYCQFKFYKIWNCFLHIAISHYETNMTTVPSVILKFLLLHKMLWRQVPIFQIYTHFGGKCQATSLVEYDQPLNLPVLAPEVEIISQHTLLHVSSSSNLTPGHTSRVHYSSASVIVSHVSLSLLWLLIVCHTALQGVSCEEALLLQGDPVWEQEHDFRDWSSPISWGQIRISWKLICQSWENMFWLF